MIDIARYAVVHHAAPQQRDQKFQMGETTVMYKLCVTAVLISQLSAAYAMEPDAKLGKRIFDMRCAMCHAAEKDAGNATGPNLNGIVGRAAGKADRYAYSEAMLKKASEVWTPERLDRFLTAPQSVLPGTSMMYPGLSIDADRQALIAFLQTLK